MRTCFVTTTFPDYAGSPRGTFILRLAELLAERGIDVSVVTPRTLRRSALEERFGAVRVRRFWFLTEDRQLAEYERVPWLRMVSYMLSGVLATCRTVAEQQAHLIHGHWVIPTGLMAVLAGRIMHRPVVLSAHGRDVLLWARHGLMRQLTQRTLNQAAACSANTAPVRDALMDLGANRERVHVIHETGVDLELFHPRNDGTAWRQRLGCSQKHILALFVGHLVKVKAVDVLLRAVALLHMRYPALRLLIVGDGPERAPLEALALQLRIRAAVHFAGALAHGKLPPVFAAADVFVLPSRSEALGIVVMEAMASGRPVVASRVGGTPDIVAEGGTGWLATPEDAGDLARQLQRLLDDPNMRRQCGIAGRAVAERRFAESLQVDRVVSMYRSVLREAASD